MHAPRYKEYPAQIMIGYGDDLTEDEKSVFTGINLKHRKGLGVMLYQGNDADVLAASSKQINKTFYVILREQLPVVFCQT